jgi:hypothetical protein
MKGLKDLPGKNLVPRIGGGVILTPKFSSVFHLTKEMVEHSYLCKASNQDARVE